MSALLLVGAILTSSTNPANGVVVRLEPQAVGTALSFSAYRPGDVALGYRLTKAETVWLGDPAISGGRKQVLRLHYTNPTSLNSFDLIQVPARAGLATKDACNEVLKLKLLDVPNDPSMTIVFRRASGVEVGFYGTMLSVPSAQTLLEGLVPIVR
ncbi:MAG: hypothetical protein KF812_08910 [Fimbriimonadaceae bacterium]|nr:hypothetical protein [Fimbriimonadaceae bacterium]